MRNLLDRSLSKISDMIHILGGSLSLRTDRHSYYPGETVTAVVSFGFGKPVKVRGITIELTCIETHRMHSSREMDHYDYRVERELGMQRSTNIRTVVQDVQKIVFSERKTVRMEGEHAKGVVEVRFLLPHSASPTSREYGHDSRLHKWLLSAKLDVPMGPDRHAESEVLVAGLSV